MKTSLACLEKESSSQNAVTSPPTLAHQGSAHLTLAKSTSVLAWSLNFLCSIFTLLSLWKHGGGVSGERQGGETQDQSWGWPHGPHPFHAGVPPPILPSIPEGHASQDMQQENEVGEGSL